ncbi:MAG TPA: hypothetical protein VGI38_00120 [Puia sp.]
MKTLCLSGMLISGIMVILMLAYLAACKKETTGTATPPPKPDTLVNILDRDTALERGGSNYGFYSVGTYLNDPTLDEWNKYLNIQ